VSVEIRRLLRKMTQHSGPARECFIDLPSKCPGRSFLPPKIRPLGKKLTGDREIAFRGCARMQANFSDGSLVIEVPFQWRDSQGPRCHVARGFVLILIEGTRDLLLPMVNCHVSLKIWGPGNGEEGESSAKQQHNSR